MNSTEKTNGESKQEKTGNSFPFERCQEMAEMINV